MNYCGRFINTGTQNLYCGFIEKSVGFSWHMGAKSWIQYNYLCTGSLIYLFPPTGSVAVSFVQNRFGHKVCMWISNVTHFLSIISLYFADSPVELYVSSALMGFNVGFVTGFTISYSSEVCEPKLRGRLSSVTNLFYFAGYLYVTTLYAATADWKISVLFTLIIPLVNSAILYRVRLPIFIYIKEY